MSPDFKFTVQDLIEQERVTADDLKTIREWFATTNLPQCNDQMLSLFLMACQNDIENTKKCAASYYKSRKEGPELFNDRYLSCQAIQHQLQILEYGVLPKRTDEGYAVMLHRLYVRDPSQYNMEVAMKILIMTMDTSLYENPPTGVIVLFDMEGVGLMHLTRIKFSAVKKFFDYVQDALPLQLKAIHVLNAVWFFDKILKLVKPFYKPELLALLHTHSPNIDMEHFYQHCIPQKCLPSDYGGHLPSVREIHKQNQRKMEELSEFFRQEQAFRT